MLEQDVIIERVRRQIHQVLVMGEEQDLGAFGELGESLEGCSGAIVVEVDQ